MGGLSGLLGNCWRDEEYWAGCVDVNMEGSMTGELTVAVVCDGSQFKNAERGAICFIPERLFFSNPRRVPLSMSVLPGFSAKNSCVRWCSRTSVCRVAEEWVIKIDHGP